MTLEEIKQAVLDGKTVHWTSDEYIVASDNRVHFVVQRIKDKCCVALTWGDGKTLNGKEEDFYVAVTAEERLRNVMVELSDELSEVDIVIGDNEVFDIDFCAVCKKLSAIAQRLIDEANK